MRTVAIGIVAFERLSRGGIEPAVITSHSLGIYAALSASGAITPGAALDAAWRAGELLREHQDESLGALLAVVGLSLDQVEEIVRNVGGSLRIAARNTGSQFVLGGEIDDLDRAEEEASEALQVERIDAGGALHTDRMDAIVPKFAEFVEQMEVRDPARPYLSHRGAAYLTSSAEVREALAGQLRDPVLWSDCLLKLGREGAWLFVDMGPGSMLKKSIRWVLRSARALSLAEGDTPEDVAAALREAEGMEGASES
ncbi:MAG: ACP S-malonyltransferase [Planctomycetota bacterium]|nr:ACP S-malonyltransferase [Planctomycetota bacterium]